MTRFIRVSLAICGVGLLVSLGGMCSRVAERGRFTVPYSTHNTAEEGSRALFLLTEAEMFAAFRWSRELLGVPAGSVVVALGGCESQRHQKLTRFEQEGMTRFLEQGGTLLVAGASEIRVNSMPVTLRTSADCGAAPEWIRQMLAAQEVEDGHRTPEDDAGAEAELPIDEADFSGFSAGETGGVIVMAEGAGPLAGLADIPLRNPGKIELEPGIEHQVLLRSNEELHAVSVSVGAGHLLVFSTASLFQNRDLKEGLGGVVFARLLRAHAERDVFFDELHLGVGQRRSMIQYFRSMGGGWVAIQCLFVLVLSFLRNGVPFGARQEPVAPLPGGTRSFLLAMGALYSRHGDVSGVLERLKRHALQRIADVHHVEVASAERLEALFVGRRQHGRAAAVKRIAEWQVPAGPPGRGLLESARALDTFVQRASAEPELDQANPS